MQSKSAVFLKMNAFNITSEKCLFKMHCDDKIEIDHTASDDSSVTSMLVTDTGDELSWFTDINSP